MPLYEYRCDNGHRFELIRKFSDPPLEACPTCGAPVHKLFSSPAIQFKGSGFYITDYAKKDQGSSSHSGDGHSESGSKDSGGGEKGEKAEKSDKTDRAEKSDKTSSTTDSSASASTTKESSAPASKESPKPKDSSKKD